jgi:uncharacterized membrane protein
MDTRTRAWAKSITWRVVGIFILGAIIYAFTQKWKETLDITILFHGVRVILYYFHERIWDRIKWGKIIHPLARFDIQPENCEVVKKLLNDNGYKESI